MAELVPVVGEVVGDIVGTVVVDGATYLLKKVVGEAGNFLWQLFTDEDGDNLPDDPENPFDVWDQEPDEWFPFPTEPDDPVISEPTQTIENIVVIAPDGVVLINPNPDSDDYDAIVSQANELWAERYGATVKSFEGYSVSEALLFIIAACALFSFFCKIFKRRKL